MNLSGFRDDLSAWNESYPIYSEHIEGDSKALTALILSLVPIIVYYVLGYIRYHQQHSRAIEQELPPVHPHFLPFIGNTISFIFDNANFLRRAT